MTRQEAQDRLFVWLQEHHERFNAPYGILKSDHGQYLSVTFGIARWVDAEVRIYSDTWILVRSSDYGNDKFTKIEDVLACLHARYLLVKDEYTDDDF